MFITAFYVLFFIKLSSSSSFNFIYKIKNKNYKIALARKTVKLKVRMPDCIISGKQIKFLSSLQNCLFRKTLSLMKGARKVQEFWPYHGKLSKAGPFLFSVILFDPLRSSQPGASNSHTKSGLCASFFLFAHIMRPWLNQASLNFQTAAKN